MATAFNLTAQLNLRGPNNVNKIVANIKKQLAGITANVNMKLDPNVAKNVKALDSSLKSLNATLTKTSTTASSAASAISSFGQSVASVNIKSVPAQINATVASMNNLNKASSSIGGSLNKSVTEMQEFGKQAGLAIRRFAAFTAVTGVIYSLTNSINQGIQAYIEYDKELVRLQQVTGKTAAGLKTLQQSISQLAVGLGVSSKELTTVSVTLAQAGLSARDTERALKALALSSLAPSFDDMNETVEGSIALMRQFGISAGQLEQALGSINAVAAAFAVEADDLITAIQRTGGVFATASKGVSEGTNALNEFISVFTSVRATTRESAETIATGLRTIFTRIQRGSTIDALKEFGVNLTDAEGKFVGAYKAVQLLSEGLSKLDPRDIKFSRIVEELGGFRQIGKVIPLIQQFAVAQDALKVAQGGQASLAKDAATAQLSLANQIQKVREEFFALFREIGQSKGFQSLVSGVLTLTRGLIKLADVSKSLLPALSVIAAFKGASALTQFASGFSKGFRPGGGKPEKEKPRFADGGVVRKFATGGIVPGVGNRDSVPAMLTPGEVVMNKSAVQKYGAGNLVRMNKRAKGGPITIEKLKDINPNAVQPDYRNAKEAKNRVGEKDQTWSTYRDQGKIGKIRSTAVKYMQPQDKVYGNVDYAPVPDPNRSEVEKYFGNITFKKGTQSVNPKDKRISTAYEDYVQDKIKTIGARYSGDYDPLDFETGDVKFYSSEENIQKYISIDKVLSKRLRHENKLNKIKWEPDSPETKALEPTIIYHPTDLTENNNLKKRISDWVLLSENQKTIEALNQGNTFRLGGLVQKFAKGGVAKTKSKLAESILLSSLKQQSKDSEFQSSNNTISNILGVPGVDKILAQIEKAYGVSSAKFLGSGGENAAFDIGDEVLKISRTGLGIQSLAKDFGVKKKDLDKMGNYQLPTGIEGVAGYRKVKTFGKLTAALQDKVTGSDSDKAMDDAQLLQGKLAKQGKYWLDAHGSNMGYDKKGNPTVIDGLIFDKSFVDKLGPDYREDIEVEGMIAEAAYDKSLKKRKPQKKSFGGTIQKFEEGGVAQRKVGYIDYDVIVNEANKDIVEKGMEATGQKGPRLYTNYLTQLAVRARKDNSLQKLRAIYGVAGSGKTTLARGQGTDSGTLRQTERFPILSPEDIQRATEVLVLSSSVSKDKLDDFFGDVDRAYTLSSTTDTERSRVKDQRGSRDITGIGLEGRQPGTTMGVSTDTAVGEALLSDKLGDKSIVLGRSGSGRLRRKKGNELVEIIKKRIGFTWGGFAPTTAGHESIMDAAAAMGIPPEDFIALVGANEAADPSSYRTAIFDQDARVLLAKAGFGARGATVLPKPRDFEVPQGFDITQQGSDRRQVLIPSQGSTAFVADKTEDQTAKYRQAGYDVKNIERTGGISGTMVRDLIIAGDMAKLQSVLSPGVYDLVSNNIGRIQNRASILPSLIEQAQKEAQAEMSQVDQQIEALGIKRIDSKKLESDPEYAAKVEVLKELRSKKQKMRSAAGFTPYKLLDALAKKDPQNYALDFSAPATMGNVPAMRVMGQNSQAPEAPMPVGRVAQLAQEKNKSIQDVILEQLGGLGGPAGVKKILGIVSGDRTLNSLLQSGNIKRGKGLEEAADYVNKALAAKGIKDAAEARRLEEYQAKAMHFGIAGLLPIDYSKEFEWNIDGTDVYATARGFGSMYLEEARQMQKESSALAQKFAENVQNKNIFGGGEKLAFDFDKTLVEDADILDAKGNPDIQQYSNRDAVKKALQNARPTRLATKLKSLIEQDPPFIKKTRILTARPQSTTDLLAQTLQSFGLPYTATDITGVSGGLSSNIAALKAANLQQEEKLIDDNLDNIRAAHKAGKKAFQYVEPKSTTSELDEKMGQGNIEGAIIEKALAVLGAPVRPDAKQNRAIDYPDGLGSAAQFFPGIDPGIPTEVKRTIDGSSLEKVREEIGRYIIGGAEAVKLARGGAVQNFMAGGAATKTRKTKEPFGTGETEFPTIISKKYAEEQKTADEFAKSKLAWDKNPKDERIMVDEAQVQEAYQQPFDRDKFLASFKEKISRDSLFERMSDFAKFVGLPQEDLTKTLPLQLDFGATKRGGGLGMFAAAQFEKGTTGIRPYEGYDLSKFGYGEKQKQESYGLDKLIAAKEKEIKKITKTPTETFDDGSFSFDREAYSKANDELAELKKKLFKLNNLKRNAEKAALADQETVSSTTGRGTISFAPSMGYASDTKNSTLYHEMTHQLFEGLRKKSADSFDKYRDRVSSLFSGDNDDLADAFDALTTNGGYSSADVVYGRSYKSNNLSQILSGYYRQNLDSSRGATPIPEDITKNLASLSTQSTAAKRAREYRPINPQVNEALLQAGDKFGMTQEKINRMEDNGKEEFLTTLIEKYPQLDKNLQEILDSTLTELLSGAGIQRQKYATGGTVPALVSNGEAYIPPKIAKKIGYSNLNRMNQADRNGMSKFSSGGISVFKGAGTGTSDSIPANLPVGSFILREKATEALGFNKGGTVPVQRFAGGGDVTRMIMSWLSSDMVGATKPKMAPRPAVVNDSSVVASNDATKALDNLVKALNELGLSAANSAEILNKGGQVSYKTIEKALAEDIKRLRISGASIQSIVAAETTLANIRKKSKEEVAKQKNIQGLTSLRGSSSTKIIGGQTIGDLQAGSGAGQQAIETQAQMLAAARIKRRGGKVTEKQRSEIMESSYIDSASRITGIKKKEFKAAGISGEDIQKYISDSMRDRKSLSQMDKQLVALRLEEYNLHKTVNGVAVTSAKEAERLAKEEISTRRKIINELSAQNGTRGVGAAGLRDYRNSPILNQLKNFVKSPGRVFGAASTAAGLVAGSSDMIAKNMYNMSTTEGQGKAAKTGAALQSSGTILSTGLAAASQMAAIPVVGPYVAGLTAVGTAALAAADYFYDFTGSQKAATQDFERSLRAKEIGIAMDDLDRAFQNFQKDMGNIDLQNALEKSLGNASSLQIKDNFAERDIAKADFALKNRTWSDIFTGSFKGSAQMDAPTQNAMDSEMSQKMSVVADKAMALYETQINQGKSIEDIVNQVRTGDKAAVDTGAAVAFAANPKLWAEVEQKVKASGDASDANRTEILREIVARELLTNKQLETAQKTKQLSDAMDAANRAGRRLAESFQNISETIDQSINRIQQESETRQAQVNSEVEARRGNAGFDDRAVNNRNVGVLTNPKAYQNDPKRIEDAIKAGTIGMAPDLAQKMGGAAKLEATLPNVMRTAISSELKSNAGLTLDEAADAARKKGTEAIKASGLSETDQRVALDKLNASIDSQKEKAQKENQTPATQVDAFSDSISELGPEIANMFGNAGKKLDDLIKARQGIYNTFAKNLEAAADAARKARDSFNKAKDIRYNAKMDLREAQTGVGESYDEAKAKFDSDIKQLTGGATDPQAIGQNIDNLTAKRKQQMDARDAAMSNPNLTQDQQKAEAEKFAKDIQATNNALNDNREALDKMANSAELAQKALDEVKNVKGLQQDRENFVNQLLTNTPEEADKLNQSFIRLQRNLSGGLNGPGNQRDAKNAYNDTLRRTGSVREATRAGNTVLADQRKQTLQLMQDPGFRGMMTLNMKNESLRRTGKEMSNEQIDKTFRQQEGMLMQQMAVESGMINNPMVRQALAAKQDPNADPAMKRAADQFLQATGLQAKATEEQGRLELANVQSLLVTATDDLRKSIDALTTSINAWLGKDGERVPGAVGPMAPVPAGARVARPIAPVGRSSGGIINGLRVKPQYASVGKLIDFSPKGTDTVPAMLTPGEFVVNARSTSQHLPLLKAINSGSGVDATANMSKGGVVYLNDGGLLAEFQKIDANKSNFLESGEIDLQTIQRVDRDRDNKISFSEYAAIAQGAANAGGSTNMGQRPSVKSGFKAQYMNFGTYSNDRAKKYSDRYQGTRDEFPRESDPPKKFAKGVPTKRRPSLVPGDPRAKDTEPSFFRLDLNEDGILDNKEGYPYQDLDKDKDGNITQTEWKNNVLARAEVRKLENQIKIDQQTIDDGGATPPDFEQKKRKLGFAKINAGMAAAPGYNGEFVDRQKRIDDNVNKRLLGGGSLNSPDGSYVFNRELNKIYDRRSAFEEERRAQRAKDENATDEEIFDRTVEAYGAGDSNYWRNSMGVSELPNVYDNSRTLDVIRNESDLSSKGDPNGEKTRAYIDGYIQSQGARQQADRVARGIGVEIDSPDIAVTGTQGPVDNLNYLIDQKEKGRVAEKAARDERFKEDNKQRADAQVKQAEKQANLEKRAKELGVTVDTSDIRGTVYESGGGFSNQPGSGRAVSVEEQKQRRVEKAINNKLSFTDKTGRYSTTGTIDKVDLEKGTVRIAKMDGKTGQPKVDENGEQVYTTVPLDKLSNQSRDKVIAEAEARGEAVIKEDDDRRKRINDNVDQSVAGINIDSSLPSFEPAIPLAEDFTDRANQIRQETMTDLAMEQSRLDSSEQLPEVAPSRRAIDPVTGRIMGPKSDHPSIDAQAESELKIDRKFKLKDTEARYQELRDRSKAESSYDRSWLGENWPKEWGGVEKPKQRLTRKELEELGRMESERGVPWTSRLGANVTAEQTRRESGLEEAQIESLSQQETKQFQTQLEKDKDSEGGEAVGLAAQRAVVPLLAGTAAVVTAPAWAPVGLLGGALTIGGGVVASLATNKAQDYVLQGTDFDKRQRELAEKRPGATAVGSLLPGLLTGNPLTGAATMGRALLTRVASGATETALGAGIRGATNEGDFGTWQDAVMDFISGFILPSSNFGSKGSRNYSRPEGPAKPKTEAVALKELAKTVKTEQRARTRENVIKGENIIEAKKDQASIRESQAAVQRVEAAKEAAGDQAAFDFFSPILHLLPQNGLGIPGMKDVGIPMSESSSPLMRGTSAVMNRLNQEFKLAATLGQADGLTTEQLTKSLLETGIDPERAAAIIKQRNDKARSDKTIESAKTNAERKQKLDAEFAKELESAKDKSERRKIELEYREADKSGITIEELRQQKAGTVKAKEQSEVDSLLVDFVDSLKESSKPTTIDNPPIGKPLDLGIDPLAPITSARDNAATTAASNKPTKTENTKPNKYVESSELSSEAADVMSMMDSTEAPVLATAKDTALAETAGKKPTGNPSVLPDRSLGFFQQKGDSRWFDNPDAIKTKKDLLEKGEISGATGYKTRFTPKPGQLDSVKELIAKDPELASMITTLKTNEDFLVLYSTKGNAEQAAAINARIEQLAGDKLVEGGATSYGDNIPLGKYGSARFDPDNGGAKAEYIDTLYGKMRELVKNKEFTDNNPEFTKVFTDSRNAELAMIPRMKLNNPNATLDTAKIVYNVGDYIKSLPEDIQASLYKDIPEFEGNDLSRQVKSAQEAQRASVERTPRESTSPQQKAAVETATRDATSTPTKAPITGDEFELGELSPETIASMAEEARIESQARTTETKPSLSSLEQNPEDFTAGLAETLSPFPEGFFPNGSSKPDITPLKESDLGRTQASSPEAVSAGQAAKKKMRERRQAAKSSEQISVEKIYGPLYREAKKANDTVEMARIQSEANAEFKKRSQEALSRSENKKNSFLPVMSKVLAIAAPIGTAIGYGLGSLLSGSMGRKQEEPQDLPARLKDNAASAQATAKPVNPMAPQQYGAGVYQGPSSMMPTFDLTKTKTDAAAMPEIDAKDNNAAPMPEVKKPVKKARGGLIYASEGMKIPRPNTILSSSQSNSGLYDRYAASASQPIDIGKSSENSFSRYIKSGGRRMSDNVEVRPKLTTDEVLQYFENKEAKERREGAPPAGGRVQYATGGIVYANNGALINAQPMGTDTVPAMLTPGEFVIKRSEAQKHMPLLEAINSGSYSRGGLVNYMANGGLVIPHYLKEGSKSPVPAPAPVTGGVSSSVGVDVSGLTSLVAGLQKTVNDLGPSIPSMSQVAENINSAVGTFVSSGAQVGDIINNAINPVVQGLREVNIPDQITVAGTVDSRHTFNGAEAANQVLSTMGSAMEQQANQKIGQFAGAINRGIGNLGEGVLGPDTGQIMGQIGGTNYA